MTDRALSFGAAADDYHHYRPGYPDELVDVVVAHAAGPVRRAIEVGAGTGKATTVFAGRGIEVVAVEPDAGMRAVLVEETRGLPVEVVAGTWESVDLTAHAPVDLCFAAASFHWTDPATRWQRAAAAIRPGGVVAVFGAQTVLADSDLAALVRAIEDEVLGTAPDPPQLQAAYTELDEVPELTDPRHLVIPRRTVQVAEHYVRHLATVSAYLVLDPAVRAETLERVLAALPPAVELAQDVGLHLARRA